MRKDMAEIWGALMIPWAIHIPKKQVCNVNSFRDTMRNILLSLACSGLRVHLRVLRGGRGPRPPPYYDEIHPTKSYHTACPCRAPSYHPGPAWPTLPQGWQAAVVLTFIRADLNTDLTDSESVKPPKLHATSQGARLLPGAGKSRDWCGLYYLIPNPGQGPFRAPESFIALTQTCPQGPLNPSEGRIVWASSILTSGSVPLGLGSFHSPICYRDLHPSEGRSGVGYLSYLTLDGPLVPREFFWPHCPAMRFKPIREAGLVWAFYLI
ncbi:hypothetical protein AVEN_52009-1 [Araneus ventricosus]|uniref:Uncharacterized protein n=1 Tax=Araneus ventricosus TaxID=182803 RepID=A0A4Y2CG50_ARAVE|nr:hypothetical protein AVEN_52009-1 [Araneus ventricosus]